MCDALKHCHDRNTIHRDIKSRSKIITKNMKTASLVDLIKSHQTFS